MKAILFIGDTYIATIEELQQILKANNSKKNKAFGRELLYYFNEGVLSDWLNEHGCPNIANTLPKMEDLHKCTDNSILKSIYRSVLNNTECLIDLDSVFSEMASLIRCEVNGKEVPCSYYLAAEVKETDEVSFVFLASENIEEEMPFVLKKVGYYSVQGEGFIMGEDIGETHLFTKTSGNHSSGSEFTVSFGFQEWNQHQRQGKYLLKYIGKKSELLCELVYQPLSHIEEPTSEIETKGDTKLLVSHVQFENSDFYFMCDPYLNSHLCEVSKETGIDVFAHPKGMEYADRIEKMIENINFTMEKGTFRLVTKDELTTIFRWATYWDFDVDIDICFYYAFRSYSDNSIKFCNIELNELEKPPFYDFFMVLER